MGSREGETAFTRVMRRRTVKKNAADGEVKSEVAPQTLMKPFTKVAPSVTTVASIPPIPMTLSQSSGINPLIQNVVATVSLGCQLELLQISKDARNTEFKPARFSALVMRIREPRSTALIFSSGKVVCTGSRSVEDSLKASRRYARIIQKLGYTVKFENFRVQNLVGSCDVNFPIRLEGLVHDHQKFGSYEPELFHGLVYRMLQPRVVILIFTTGKLVFTGAKTESDICEAFENIYPICKGYRM